MGWNGINTGSFVFFCEKVGPEDTPLDEAEEGDM
jgi:hypothetical protein